MNFVWMAWTVPTAVFFAAIAAAVVLMSLWQWRRPQAARRGGLPIATTRGDRFFIGLLVTAFIHIGWLASTDAPAWIALTISLAAMTLILRYG